jgi:hypothetical protein
MGNIRTLNCLFHWPSSCPVHCWRCGGQGCLWLLLQLQNIIGKSTDLRRGQEPLHFKVGFLKIDSTWRWGHRLLQFKAWLIECNNAWRQGQGPLHFEVGFMECDSSCCHAWSFEGLIRRGIMVFARQGSICCRDIILECYRRYGRHSEWRVWRSNRGTGSRLCAYIQFLFYLVILLFH